MKYMGSKRSMLQNGLGVLIAESLGGVNRFVDLFAGSGAVSTFVARNFPISVLATDLQRYSVVLNTAVVARQTPLNWQPVWERWLQRATAKFRSRRVPRTDRITRAIVTDVRHWSHEQADLPITRAYGGHYFSPRQAAWIDALRVSLPRQEPAKSVALAALIQAASQCAAAPGHTAQPFQPTRSAKRFISEAWGRDIVEKTRLAFELLSNQFAQQAGEAEVVDANLAARQLHPGDLVFIDPPYSGVHYSRYYHVLETIAVGNCGDVSGAGRYPAQAFRPISRYSISSESAVALDDLLQQVALRDASAILTFPNSRCSNGLSGQDVLHTADRYFTVQEHLVNSRFSTLGGTGDNRGNEAGRLARVQRQEMMLVLTPL